MRRRSIYAAYAAMAMTGIGWDEPIAKAMPSTQKCALPECTNRTTRSYCCAEHCKTHRERLKGDKRS